ncbi:MAG: hypothetical protein R3E09_13025 [Novosphingobium sp.]
MAQGEKPGATSEWRDGWTLVAAAMVGYSLSSIPAGSTGVMMGLIERDFGWTRTEIYCRNRADFIHRRRARDLHGRRDRPPWPAPHRSRGGPADVRFGRDALDRREQPLAMVERLAIVGVAAATMPTVWLAPVASRFNASRGLAVAIVLSRSGVATFLVPIVTHALTEQYGWRGGYVGLGAIWALVSVPIILLFFKGTAPAS